MMGRTFTKNGRIKNSKFLSNTIPKAEDMWDIQERDGHCEAGTGQEPNSWKQHDDDDNNDRLNLNYN
jgi:hypothetical protein